MRLVKNTERLSSRAEVLLAKVGTILQCQRKKAVYSQGSAARGIYYIQKGMVMLTVQSDHRRPVIVAVLGPGSFFNEICLLDHSQCLSTARAITSSSILVITKEKMASLLLRKNVVSTFFVSSLLSSMLRFREDLADVLVNSTEQRLARALVRLAHFGKGQRIARIPKMSQQVLAEMIGTTRSRVNLFMNRFRKRGFINYNGGLEVRSSLRAVLLRH
jgi:CRP/FNR family transcriptional regulator, cyclic AMP receptor protein